MASGAEKRALATIVVHVYSNGFAGYAVAPRIEGDNSHTAINLSGTTLPLHCSYEIAGDYVPHITDRQTRIDDLVRSIESLEERGFKVTRIPM